MPAAAPFGHHLRTWRTARQLSQEALAGRAGVSPRHLSFVENGRAQPSRELVVALAGALDVPLRDRNALLLAAGFAPAYAASPLDGDELRHLRRAIDHLLALHAFGAVVVDRLWNVVQLNDGAARLIARFPPRTPDGTAAMRNLLLGTLHPEALRPYLVNWHELAGHLVARLHREIAAAPGDDDRRRLLAALLALPGVPADWRAAPVGTPAAPFALVHLRAPDGLELRLFTMLTSIGTPLDVTAEDLHIESYFPADDATEAALRSLAPAPAPAPAPG